MGRSISFVQPRGGVGKTTAVVQLAASLAALNPSTKVVVIDASIHGDATTMLLGGFSEPLGEDFYTKGGETSAKFPDSKLQALFETLKKSREMKHTLSLLEKMWRPSGGAETPTVDIVAMSVNVLKAHPAGNAPPNLFLVTGGELIDQEFNEPEIAVALREAMDAAPDVVFLIDTDAEITERGPTLIVTRANTEIFLVTSPNWADFLRCVSDPVNKLRDLKDLTTKILFTKVPKTLNTPTDLEGVPCFGFKPVKSSMENVATICAYVRERKLLPPGDSLQDFIRNRVLALPELPDVALNISVDTGEPIAVGGGNAKDFIDFVARRI
jgi:hypothetical protein